MKNILIKIAIVGLAVMVGLVGCGKKETEQNNKSKEAPHQTETTQQDAEMSQGKASGFTEEQKLTVAREILNIWYVKRLSATKKEELEPVRAIFKDPEAFKSGIEVFFDNGIAGKFKDITLQLDKERTVDIKDKVFYYEAEATVSSINKDTGAKESFKELIKMMIEQNDKGKFQIHDIQGKMMK